MSRARTWLLPTLLCLTLLMAASFVWAQEVDETELGQPKSGAVKPVPMTPGLQAWIDEAKAAADAAPKDAAKLAEYGRRLVLAGQEGEGLTALTKAEAMDPDNPDVLLSKAKAMTKTGAYQVAEEAALKAARSPLARKKLAAEGYVMAANMRIRANDLTTAEEYAKEAVKLDPKNGGAHLNLAMLFFGTERKTDALQELEIAARYDLNNAKFQSSVARLFEGMALGERAKEIWKRVVALSPNDGESRFILARYCLQAGEWSEAATLLREAVTINPADGNSHLALGIAVLQLGDFQEAERQADVAEKLGIQVKNLRDSIQMARENKK